LFLPAKQLLSALIFDLLAAAMPRYAAYSQASS